MSKKKEKTVTLSMNTLSAIVTKQEIKTKLAELDGLYTITEATLKDGFCVYKYDVLKGVQAPNSHKVDGRNLFKDDLQNAFNKLRVHLAVIDGAFALSKIEIADIDQLHVDNITLAYEITSIKIKGVGDNEAVIITGNKHVGAFGRMDLESPRISMDHASSYQWHNELKEAVDNIREEVALYHEGYYTPTEVEEVEEDENQLKISFSSNSEEHEEEFENAKV